MKGDALTQIYIVVIALPFLFGTIWFAYNVWKSALINAKFLSAPKAHTLSTSTPRNERIQRLPVITRPPRMYVLNHGEFTQDEIEPLGVQGVLDSFERHALQAATSDLFATGLSGADYSTMSMVIGTQATPLTRFIGWLRIERMGYVYKWSMTFSEVRWMRVPDEGNSHFSYHHGHEHRLYNSIFKRQDDSSGLLMIWDLLTGNTMSESTAKKAEMFRYFLMQRLSDAQSEAALTHRRPPIVVLPESTYSSSSEIAVPLPEPRQERKRPTRRD